MNAIETLLETNQHTHTHTLETNAASEESRLTAGDINRVKEYTNGGLNKSLATPLVVETYDRGIE